jgi:16S rRNA pseudouridine516 synthase
LPVAWSSDTVTAMTLIRLLANLGYGSRREVEKMIRAGGVTDANGMALGEKSRLTPDEIRVGGEALDPQAPLVLLMHKPAGVTCSHDDPGEIVFDLLPPRFLKRNPPVSCVGRLDKETTGLLLFTDDGQLLHRLISPKSECPKTYIATLDRPLRGDEAEVFASGTLLLNGETKPLLPAEMTVLDERTARLVIHEGRYHQVRRMFAACGNHVTALHRESIGGLLLPDDLKPGDWRVATAEETGALRGGR